VLRLSSGIDEPGVVMWDLCLCLLLAWIVVYFCIWKGIRSSGKVICETEIKGKWCTKCPMFILLLHWHTSPSPCAYQSWTKKALHKDQRCSKPPCKPGVYEATNERKENGII